MVPGHIELAGYDQIRYINTMYPWEGKTYRRGAYTCGNNISGASQISNVIEFDNCNFFKIFAVPFRLPEFPLRLFPAHPHKGKEQQCNAREGNVPAAPTCQKEQEGEEEVEES